MFQFQKFQNWGPCKNSTENSDRKCPQEILTELQVVAVTDNMHTNTTDMNYSSATASFAHDFLSKT